VGLELGKQLAQGVHGVAKQQCGDRLVEELVLDAGEARAHRTLHEDHLTRLVGVQDRHAVDRGSRGRLGGRVDHIVGANDQGDVRLLEFRIDLVISLSCSYGTWASGTPGADTLSRSIGVYLVSADSRGLAADCETITRQKLKAEEETISWCRVCGWYHLFGATEISRPAARARRPNWSWVSNLPEVTVRHAL
jgi:hypothetical protein